MPIPVPTMLSTKAVAVPATAPRYQPIVPPMNAPRVLSIFIMVKTLGGAEGYAAAMSAVGATGVVADHDAGAPLLKIFGGVVAAPEQLMQHLVPNEHAVVDVLAREQDPVDTVPPVAIVLHVVVDERRVVRHDEPGDARHVSGHSRATLGGLPPIPVRHQRRQLLRTRGEVGRRRCKREIPTAGGDRDGGAQCHPGASYQSAECHGDDEPRGRHDNASARARPASIHRPLASFRGASYSCPRGHLCDGRTIEIVVICRLLPPRKTTS